MWFCERGSLVCIQGAWTLPIYDITILLIKQVKMKRPMHKYILKGKGQKDIDRVGRVRSDPGWE